jgi:hypothetical protein
VHLAVGVLHVVLADRVDVRLEVAVSGRVREQKGRELERAQRDVRHPL